MKRVNTLLEPSQEVVDKYGRIEEKAQTLLEDYLTDPQDVKLLKAKIALGTLSVIKGNRASFSAQRAVNYQIIRDISKDRVELKKYVKATQPQLKLL